MPDASLMELAVTVPATSPLANSGSLVELALAGPVAGSSGTDSGVEAAVGVAALSALAAVSAPRSFEAGTEAVSLLTVAVELELVAGEEVSLPEAVWLPDALLFFFLRFTHFVVARFFFEALAFFELFFVFFFTHFVTCFFEELAPTAKAVTGTHTSAIARAISVEYFRFERGVNICDYELRLPSHTSFPRKDGVIIRY